MANTNLVALTGTAASAGVNGGDMENLGARAAIIVVDTTVMGGTAPTLTITVQGKDEASGKYYTLLASTAIATVSTTVLRIGPGLTAAANAVANDFMPKSFRVISAIGGTTPAITFTVGVSLIG